MVDNDGQMLINELLGLVADQLSVAEEEGFKTRAHRAGTRSMLSTLKSAAKAGRADPERVAQLRRRMADLEA